LTDDSRYPAQVFWSDEDEGYIALATDLPGCSAFGETQHEALAELRSAIVAWIEAARAAGNPIPDPSRPAEYNIYSGKMLVRMPKSLHAQLAQSAKAEAVSLNQHIVFLLTWATTHRTLTTDWTVANGASTYGVHSPGQFGGHAVIWTKFTFETTVPTLQRETPSIMTNFIPQRAIALSSRTA